MIMRNIIIIIMLSLISKDVLSQIGENDLKYYDLTYDAERQIVNGAYGNALLSYKKAIRMRNAFAVDIYNAAICAVLTRKINSAFELCELLANRGVGSDFFVKSNLFNTLKKYDKKKWDDILRKAKVTKHSIRSNNEKTFKILDSLLLEDQNWNEYRIAGSQDRSKSKISRDSFERVTWAKVDTISLATFKYFQQYGYPSEFEIGPYIENDTMIMNFPFFWPIIVHNYQGIARSDTIFTSVLNNELSNGKIKPSLFALLQDFGNVNFKRPYYGTSKMYWSVNNTLYVIPFYKNSEHAQKISFNRSLIGLPTIPELEQFLLMMQNSNHKSELQYFVFSVKPTRVALSSPELEKDFVKPMELVK